MKLNHVGLLLLAVSAIVLSSCGNATASSAPTVGAGATSSPPASSGTAPGAAAGAWTTYHHDNARSGQADSTGTFNTVSEDWASPVLDGEVYAEPLVLDGIVYVATENNSIFAINETSGQVAWTVHLGTSVNASNFPCGNVNPIGITSTPVLDPVSRRLFVVGMVQGRSGPRQRLFALDIETHRVVYDVPIDPAGTDPRIENQRGALALANGHVYVTFGGRFGDCGSYHGYVVAADAGDGSLAGVYQTTRSGRAGGISGRRPGPPSMLPATST